MALRNPATILCPHCRHRVEPERVITKGMPSFWICTFCGVWLQHLDGEKGA